MRAARITAIAAILYLAAIAPSFAFSQTISVPPGTISVTIVTTGTNTATKQITYVTTTSFCPSGSTVTVSQPNNTPDTMYGSSVTFSDANGNIISVVTVVQVDGSPGGAGGGGKPTPTQPQAN